MSTTLCETESAVQNAAARSVGSQGHCQTRHQVKAVANRMIDCAAKMAPVVWLVIATQIQFASAKQKGRAPFQAARPHRDSARDA